MIPLKDCSWFDSCNWIADSEEVKTWNTNFISVKLINKSWIDSYGIDDLPPEDFVKGSFFSGIKKAIVQAYEVLTNSASMAFYGNFRAMVIKNREASALPTKLKFYGMPLIHLLTNSNAMIEVLDKVLSKNEGSYFSIPVIEICKLYEGQNFTEEEIACLALEENRAIFRQLLNQFLNKSIKQHKSEVEDLCADFINNLSLKSQNSYINISDECRVFTVSIMSKYVFGNVLDPEKAAKISIAINKLMYFFTQSDLGKKAEDTDECCCYSKQIYDETLISLENHSLKNDTIIKSLKEKGYSHNQISVMVVIILGSAVDNLSEFLAYMLMQLALNLSVQVKMRNDNALTKKIVAESLRMFNSDFILKRHLEEDSVMMIKNIETKEIYPYYMQAGDKIVCAPNLLSSCQDKFEEPLLFDPESHQKHKDTNLYTFGSDESICPAKKLCLGIAESVVSKFLELNFFIKVNFFEPIPLAGDYTTKLENDLYGKVVKELEFYDF